MTSYAERPWLRNYPEGVPHDVEEVGDFFLHDMLRESARRQPQATALITPARLPLLGYTESRFTYVELEAASDAFANALLTRGLEKGDRVAVVMPNCVAFAIVYFAILKAGGVVSAVNPTYPPARMAYQLDNSDARICVVLTPFYQLVKSLQAQTKVECVIAANIKEYLPGLARTLFTIAREKKDGHAVELQSGDEWFQDVLAAHGGEAPPDVPIQGDDLAFLQYTGGTTGVSKGAMLTHKMLASNLMQIQLWLDSSVRAKITAGKGKEDLVYLGALPMFHVFGLVVVLSGAIYAGSRVVLVANPRDVSDMVGVIDHYRPDIMLGVPAMYNAISHHPEVRAGQKRLDGFCLAMSGAAPLPSATKRAFEEVSGCRLSEGYGMSEVTTAAIALPFVGPHKPESAGLPLPGMHIRVMDIETGSEDVPVGEKGEIVMAGPNIMQGYFKMPTESQEVLRERDGRVWVHSGDIGYMDEDGYFYIVDRKKDMALIGGYNVYPANIENALKEHTAVAEVGVAAIPHPEREGQQALKAWVVLAPGAEVTAGTLTAHCEQYLAPYEVPRRIEFIDELPKTAIGKTLRRELVRIEAERVGAGEMASG